MSGEAVALNAHILLPKLVEYVLESVGGRCFAHATRESLAKALLVRRLYWSTSIHFWHNSLFSSRKSQRKSLKTLFLGSRSFKVIDVDTTKKYVISACYDKQHVCSYLQQFSR